jgi:hypothetical protein
MKKKIVKLDRKQLRGLITETFQKITAEELTAWKAGDFSSAVTDKPLHEETQVDLNYWADMIEGQLQQVTADELGDVADVIDELYQIVDKMRKSVRLPPQGRRPFVSVSSPPR